MLTFRHNVWTIYNLKSIMAHMFLFHESTWSSNYLCVCWSFNIRSDTWLQSDQPYRERGSRSVYDWHGYWHDCRMDNEGLWTNIYCYLVLGFHQSFKGNSRCIPQTTDKWWLKSTNFKKRNLLHILLRFYHLHYSFIWISHK